MGFLNTNSKATKSRLRVEGLEERCAPAVSIIVALNPGGGVGPNGGSLNGLSNFELCPCNGLQEAYVAAASPAQAAINNFDGATDVVFFGDF